MLTAGSDELGGGYIERLTIDADSGVPLNSVGGSAGGETATVHYKVSRGPGAPPRRNAVRYREQPVATALAV